MLCMCTADGTLKLYSVSEEKQLHSCSPSVMVGLCVLLYWLIPLVWSSGNRVGHINKVKLRRSSAVTVVTRIGDL